MLLNLRIVFVILMSALLQTSAVYSPMQRRLSHKRISKQFSNQAFRVKRHSLTPNLIV